MKGHHATNSHFTPFKEYPQPFQNVSVSVNLLVPLMYPRLGREQEALLRGRAERKDTPFPPHNNPTSPHNINSPQYASSLHCGGLRVRRGGPIGKAVDEPYIPHYGLPPKPVLSVATEIFSSCF